MLTWLRHLFHLHRWGILGRGDIAKDDGRVVGTYYTLQCKECGDIKCRRVE